MQGTSVIGPPHAHVLEEEVGDDVLLYDAARGQFVSLNATAGDVWRLSDGDLTFDEIVERLASAYGLGRAEMSGAVATVVEEFVAADLLQITDQG